MLTRYKNAVAILLVLLCVLVVALLSLTVTFLITKYAPPDASPADGTDTATDLPGDGSTDAAPDGVTLPETPDAGTRYQDSLIFVGDARTAHLITRGVLTGGTATTQVWRTESGVFNLKPGVSAQPIIYPGPGANTGKAMTVAEAAALKKPRILVVTLGADWGIAYLTEAEFKACYTELIQDIQESSPGTVILLQSIFPVAEHCTLLSNTRIDAANRWIKAVALDAGCGYLDTQRVLKDASGNLKAEFSAPGNGLHLSAEGYEAILDYIRTHAVGG